MPAILGISAFYHDAAAALVVDGTIVAAAQEERFSRRRHDASFPHQAVAYCLREAGLRVEDLDHVGFYEKPYRRFERLLATWLAFAPRGFGAFLHSAPPWLGGKWHVSGQLDRALGGRHRKRFVFVEHHEAHAASAFFPSPFDEAAILTLDGVGEWATATCGRGSGRTMALLEEMRFPHSLGLLYSAFTTFCGFRVNSGEYKLMGLAPYGEPRYVDRILEHLVDLRDDGSLHLDQSYFDYCAGLRMTSPRFEALFGGPPRPPESPITQREMDLAASIQQVTETAMLGCARHAAALTGARNLCLAGGVALNGVGVGRIQREGPFERVWVQPAAGDAGGALGVALFIWHQLLGQPRAVTGSDRQRGSLLGPREDEGEIRRLLDEAGARYRHVADEDALADEVAALLADGKVVGWFQGRMEFGPRALGSRSILGDARRVELVAAVNRIKRRESFRPLAPAVLSERAPDYFDLPEGSDSPFMMLVVPVLPARRKEAPPGPTGLERLASVRSEIPAVTHLDHSARVQTVDRARHGRFHVLLERFAARTGCPVVVNTSFNVRGEPVVCRASEALQCFRTTELDALVLERFLLLRTEQPPAFAAAPTGAPAAFPLD